MTHREFILSVIRVRKLLIKLKRSNTNVMQTMKVMKKIERQVMAYGSKWNKGQWSAFFRRNYDDIVFLIPGNNASKNRIETLNTLTL